MPPNMQRSQSDSVVATPTTTFEAAPCDSSLFENPPQHNIELSPSDIIHTICRYIDDIVSSVKPDEDHGSCTRYCSGIVYRKQCENKIQLDLDALLAHSWEAREQTSHTPSILPLDLVREIIIRLTCAHCHRPPSRALQHRAKSWHVQGIKWENKDQPFAEPTTPDFSTQRQSARKPRSKSSSSRQSRRSKDTLAEPATPTSRPPPSRRKASAGQNRRKSSGVARIPDEEDEHLVEGAVGTSTSMFPSNDLSTEHLPELQEDCPPSPNGDISAVDMLTVPDPEDAVLTPSTDRSAHCDAQPDVSGADPVEWSPPRISGAFDFYDSIGWSTELLTSSVSAQDVVNRTEQELELRADRTASVPTASVLDEDSTLVQTQGGVFEPHDPDGATASDPPIPIQYELFQPHSRSRASALVQFTSLFRKLKHYALVPQEGGVYGMQLLKRNADTDPSFVKIGLTRRHWLDRISGIEWEADAKIDRNDVIWEMPNNSSWVPCLENLIHRDLQHLNHRRYNRLGPGAKSQTEWYKISMTDARLVVQFWREISDELAWHHDIGDVSLAQRVDELRFGVDHLRLRSYTHEERIAHYREKLLVERDPAVESLPSPPAIVKPADMTMSAHHTAGLIILITVSMMACVAFLHLLRDTLSQLHSVY